MTMSSPLPSDPSDLYRMRSRRFANECTTLDRRSGVIGWLRVGGFGVALLLVLGSFDVPLAWRPPMMLGGIVTLIAFFGLVVAHARVRERRRWFGEHRAVNEEALDRLDRKWDRLPTWDPGVELDDHAYATDLDLFGRASLSRLLTPAATTPGRSFLARELLTPADADVPARQDAVRELAPEVDFRDALTAHGRLGGPASPHQIETFTAWAEGDAVKARSGLRVAVRVLPVALVVLLVAHQSGGTRYPLWVLPVIAAFVIHARTGQGVAEKIGRALVKEEIVARYAAAMAHVVATPFRSSLLTRLQGEMTKGGVVASRELGRLQSILSFAAIRSVELLHRPLQVLLLWDWQVLLALERWQRRAGAHVRRWMDALGEVDGLAALAAVSCDHPAWSFPEVRDDGEHVIEAAALGHPLLPPTSCVRNDVTVGPSGTFLLVTGSNMSGKSTLLRAIGVNVVLAQIGGPVCATRMRLPRVAAETSMRVSDSLERGVSHFMAELRRLKGVVDAARRGTTGRGRPVLYLLDDVLHGTNSAERQIAVRRVIRYLLQARAIGAVTTHDLSLADTEDLRRAGRPVHFQETVAAGEDGEPVLSFDYRLRPGLATSTNALALLRAVGLDTGNAVGRGGS